jgi:hypothetical protein
MIYSSLVKIGRVRHFTFRGLDFRLLSPTGFEENPLFHGEINDFLAG